MGHVRDLPKSELGVDVENSFAPKYVVPRDKRSIVKDLKERAKGAQAIYLATDPDREGEAIAWHLASAIAADSKPLRRIEFHEITKEAIQRAVKAPRQIDMKRVDAQQARRILDRLVGYKLSPLLWKKIRKGLSAGRVQSVVVRLIVEREREIAAFKNVEFWNIFADFKKGFSAQLKIEISSETEAREVEKELSSSQFMVGSIEEKE